MSTLALAVAALTLAGFAPPGFHSKEAVEPVASVGKRAPELSAIGWVNTKTLTLESLEGKIVVLAFWGTYAHGRTRLSTLDQIHKKNEGQAVVVGVHCSRHADEMAAFVKRNHLGLPCCEDDLGITSDRYEARRIPYIVFIDRKGIVRALLTDPTEDVVVKTLFGLLTD